MPEQHGQERHCREITSRASACPCRVRGAGGCGLLELAHCNACANDGGTEFRTVDIATEGELRTFTIVAFAAPGVPVPFVAGVIDCDGTSVRANVINVEPDPAKVSLGMKVRFTTFAAGTDDEGTEAVGFGFEPQE